MKTKTVREIARFNSRRLAALAARIKAANEAFELAMRTGFERALEVGKLLMEAKAEVPHGEWLPWLKNVGISERRAQKYMRLVAKLPAGKYDSESFLPTMGQALAEISRPRAVDDREVDNVQQEIDELDAERITHEPITGYEHPATISVTDATPIGPTVHRFHHRHPHRAERPDHDDRGRAARPDRRARRGSAGEGFPHRYVGARF